jgi:hypothetical protein
MIVTGYDEDLGFEVMNSWGQNWGDKRYGWIAYEQFKRCVVEAYWAKDVIPTELSGVAASHAVDPLIAIQNVWQSLITVGRFSDPPTVDDLDDVIPNSILPKDKDDKAKFLKALRINLVECKKVALLPVVRDWGKPEHQTIGLIQRFTFSPKFFPSDIAVPEDISAHVDIGKEGEVKGWGFQGRLSSRINVTQEKSIDAAVSSLDQTASGAGGSSYFPRETPNLQIGEQLVEQPVRRGTATGVAITIPGYLHEAANHQLLLVAHFTFPNGQPLFANGAERRYRDWQGFVATDLQVPNNSRSTVNLSKYRLFIPYYALNFTFTRGRVTYSASVITDVFVDGIQAARTNPTEFLFPW